MGIVLVTPLPAMVMEVFRAPPVLADATAFNVAAPPRVRSDCYEIFLHDIFLLSC